MQLLKVLETGFAAYLLGSIPTGYLVGKLHHRDLRKEGSGNIGATNVLRILGKKWGYFVFAVDFLKGALAIALAWCLAKGGPQSQKEMLGLVAAVLAISGHMFPVWLRFRGGKGVATTTGVILVLLPWEVFTVALLTWILVFFTTRYVSLASLTAALTIPIVCGILFWFHAIGILFLWIGIGICILVFWRHRSNLSRLLSGTESRFTRKSKEEKNLSKTPPSNS